VGYFDEEGDTRSPRMWAKFYFEWHLSEIGFFMIFFLPESG